jgi:AAA family ATP:ADP antiporter
MFRSIQEYFQSIFDIRRGERTRTVGMFLYLLSLLFAYYILKPVTRALFLNNFDIDKLPILYIIIAPAAGFFAYLYSRVAVRTSLRAAVTWTLLIFISNMILIWWLMRFNYRWLYYAFPVWVSLFSIISTSQFWLVANNVFNPREAKRIYALLGLAAIIGAAFGGSFTKAVVKQIGTPNMLWFSALMVAVALGAFWMVLAMKGVNLRQARVQEERQEESFTFGEILAALRGYRHLQVIVGIITVTFLVDSMVEFQFNAVAKEAYQGDDLTAFLGGFYGLWLNLTSFTLQVFFTAMVVNRFGVGAALQLTPAAIAATSITAFFAPGVWTASLTRLAEAAMRYTFNRTGLEVLYLPLPLELKNRTKSFVDIFADRFARGLGGFLLLLCTSVLTLTIPQISALTASFCIVWMFLVWMAKNEYVRTVRQRFAARRFDLEQARWTVRDAATIGVLEQELDSTEPRRVSYALSLLAEAPGYQLAPRLARLGGHAAPEVRRAVYELAAARKVDGALAELARRDVAEDAECAPAALDYLLAVASAPQEVAQFVLQSQNSQRARRLFAAAVRHGALPPLVDEAWITRHAASGDPAWRAAATAAMEAWPQAAAALAPLLEDADAEVARGALRAAARIQDRRYLPAIGRGLARPDLRADCRAALASYGARIAGTLSDLLMDSHEPLALRAQIPRVLRDIPAQESVDALVRALELPDIRLRYAVLKALNHLRLAAPKLNFGEPQVMMRIKNEAARYQQLYAALTPLRESQPDGKDRRPEMRLLVAALEERLDQTLARLFRLLGLKYPPREIYAAFRAVEARKGERYTAAVEFLDNVLDKDVKGMVLPLIEHTQLERLLAERRDRPQSPVDALRALVRGDDPWLAACAMWAAVALRLQSVRSEISEAALTWSPVLQQVANDALARLG